LREFGTAGPRARTQRNIKSFCAEEVLLEIAHRGIPGYKGAELFVREAENDEMEFITLLRFETLDAVKIFAGKNYEQPVIPPDAKKLLKRHSERSRHYKVVALN